MPVACAPPGKPPKIPVINAPHNSFGIPITGEMMCDIHIPAFVDIPVLVSTWVITANGNMDGIITLLHFVRAAEVRNVIFCGNKIKKIRITKNADRYK